MINKPPQIARGKPATGADAISLKVAEVIKAIPKYITVKIANNLAENFTLLSTKYFPLIFKLESNVFIPILQAKRIAT